MPQPHVLFVEDEEFIRLSVTERLIEAGLGVTDVCNADSALDLLRERHRFDLLLTDVHMPGCCNGVDVARYVRSLWPAMPVVFATGRPDAMRLFGAFGPRDCCVLKPYRPRSSSPFSPALSGTCPTATGLGRVTHLVRLSHESRIPRRPLSPSRFLTGALAAV